jgi:hypothetical protein
MIQLLERTNLTADACNKFVQSTARSMCFKCTMVAAYNDLITRHPQLDFSMTYKTSAYRRCIDHIVETGEYLPIAEISQRLEWRQFDNAPQAAAILRGHSFRRKPAEQAGTVDCALSSITDRNVALFQSLCFLAADPGVTSLLANALHQLKGTYNEADVTALREYLTRWITAHYLHDAEFRAEAQRHVFHDGSVEDFLRQMEACSCPHPFLLECLCKIVSVGFLVWSKHGKPILFGTLRKRDKIFNLLCVRSASSADALTFVSLVVARYYDDMRLEGNPAPTGSTTEAAPSTPDEGRNVRSRQW